jgi:gas vesicle protein
MCSRNVEHTAEMPPPERHGGYFGYLVAGLGIGAAVSIFFAPRSGEETRKLIANRCLNAIETSNKKVRETRTHVKEFMDRGQERINAVVAARRAAISEPKAPTASGGAAGA